MLKIYISVLVLTLVLTIRQIEGDVDLFELENIFGIILMGVAWPIFLPIIIYSNLTDYLEVIKKQKAREESKRDSIDNWLRRKGL